MIYINGEIKDMNPHLRYKPEVPANDNESFRQMNGLKILENLVIAMARAEEMAAHYGEKDTQEYFSKLGNTALDYLELAAKEVQKNENVRPDKG